MEKLILKIKKSEGVETKYSAGYDIHLNDWKLEKGVLGIKLDMKAAERPLLTIECHPDHIEIDDVVAETIFKNTFEEENVKG